MTSQRVIMAIAMLVALAGCGSGDLPLSEVDPDAVPAEPTFDQVFSIFQRECVPCHKDGDDGEGEEDEPDETGAPRLSIAGGVAPDYTTCAAIVENLEGALDRIFDKNDMPPGAWPRLTSEEKLIIERWVQQWEDGGKVSPCD